MGTNCLVTKLKSVVNNDNLEKLGVITLQAHAVESASFNLEYSTVLNFDVIPNAVVELEIIGDGEIMHGGSGKKATITGDKRFYFSNGTYQLLIKNKYGLKKFHHAIAEGVPSIWEDNSFNIDFTYIPLENLYLRNVNCGLDISSIKNCPLTSLNIFNTNITGDIANLSGKIITEMDIKNSLVYGDIAAIKQCSYTGGNQGTNTTGEIKSLPLSSSRYYTNGLLGGSIEDYVASRIEGGIDSGREITNLNEKVSFGNTTFSGVPATSLFVVNWSDLSHIWVFVGANSVYAKGATAEEIAAWEQAGKTVTVIS